MNHIYDGDEKKCLEVANNDLSRLISVRGWFLGMFFVHSHSLCTPDANFAIVLPIHQGQQFLLRLAIIYSYYWEKISPFSNFLVFKTYSNTNKLSAVWFGVFFNFIFSYFDYYKYSIILLVINLTNHYIYFSVNVRDTWPKFWTRWARHLLKPKDLASQSPVHPSWGIQIKQSTYW